MRRTILLSAVLGVLMLGGMAARADTVITFDDLTAGNPIPNGYNGLNWTNFYVCNAGCGGGTRMAMSPLPTWRSTGVARPR